MKNIFINAAENRLRAFWRILFQTGIFFGSTILLQIIVGITLGIITMHSGADNLDSVMKSVWVSALLSVLTLAAMVFSYWVGTKMDKRSFSSFGFHFSKQWWRDFGFGLALGALSMVFIFGVELAAGWLKVTGFFQTSAVGIPFGVGIGCALINFFCVGIYEEMLSRGYETRNLAEGIRGRLLNPKMAVLVSYLVTSTIFGLLHLGNPNTSWISTVLLMAAGLFLGLGYILTGELALPIGLHMTWNFFEGNVFGFAVSGTNAGATFIAIQQNGPTFLTGGAFGPEAGLIGLLAIILGFTAILLWIKGTRNSVRPVEELSVFQITQPVPVVEELPSPD
jgi:uncharacterized protein